MARPLLVNAAELLRRPGSEKTIQCEISAAELGLDDARFAADAVVAVDLHLESLTDGIVVDGELRAPWVGTCRRCLRELSDTGLSIVHELYQVELTDEEAFAIQGDQLNLVALVRECVLLDTPTSPLCRPDCKGLCLQCGVDRNEVECSCAAPKSSSPWDVLDQLRSDVDEK